MKPQVQTVSATEMATLIGITTERLRQLVHEGLPQLMRSRRPQYHPPDVIKWLRARDVETAKKAASTGSVDEAKERALKIRADREVRELELAQLRAELIPAAEFRAFCDSLAGSFASVALGQLQQFERRIVQAASPAEARRITQAMTAALMQGVQDYADTLEPEADAA